MGRETRKHLPRQIDNEDNKFKLGVKFLVEGAIGKTGLAR